MSERYQQGCLYREKRKAGPDIWAFRFRDGQVNRKEIIGNVEEYPTKAKAMRATELLRVNINRGTRTPRTIGELVTHYSATELLKKTPYTAEVYTGYLRLWILPKWEKFSLSDVRTAKVEEWLGTLSLGTGSKAKVRNLMSAIYSHAIRNEWVRFNPITEVRQGAMSENEDENVLTIEETRALLSELSEPTWRTAVYAAVMTGLRVSELLGLKWSDIETGRIKLSRGIVRQVVGKMKTKASRKPIPLHADLAVALNQWRAVCPYNQDSDYIFASPAMHGQQPYWPTAAMEKHVRPAARRAGISKRIGWHTLRHTFGTVINSQGTDTATTQSLMRHANVSVTMDRYVHAVAPAKREAQNRLAEALSFPNVPTASAAVPVTVTM